MLRRTAGGTMFWFIAAAIVVLLFALAWWSSGRPQAGRIQQHQPSTDELYQAIRDQGSHGGSPG